MHTDIDKQIVDRLNEPSFDTAEPYGWDEFRRRALLREAMRKSVGRAIAAAVALVAILLGGVIWGHMRQPAVVSHLTHPAPLIPDSQPPPDAEATKQWLANAPSEPAVVRFGTRVAVLGLEDRIAQVDDLLTAVNVRKGPSADVAALHEERDRLVSSLAQVRYAERLVTESP